VSARRLCPLALLVALAAGACEQQPTPRRADQATMALLGTARALHHEADVYEAAGDFARASQAMERVLALRLPPTFADAEDVRADAWGRLAELDLRRADPDRALARVDEALRATPRESVLQARLYMVRGQALRALAERAAAAHDEPAAARRREEALAALERSIAINERILRGLTAPVRP
jgi:tetratricopeptide (TPR) repeat protein